ncbi:MAG: hypothetical protein ACIARR_12345 [Phycisphaerales bacterium JB059]
MRTGTALVGLMGLWASIWGLPGCGASPRPAQPALTPAPPTPDATLQARDLYPPGERRFVLLDPESREARGVEIITNQAPADEGAWTQSVRTEGGAGEGERAGASVFERHPHGGVALRQLVARAPKAARDDDALYLFEPALVMTPGALAIGTTHTDACTLRIVELDDHSRVIQTGRAERTLEVLAGATLRTSGGEVETLTARAQMTMEMGAIRSVTTTRLWVEPGEGILIESFDRVSRLMGVPVRRSRGLKHAEGIEPVWGAD